MSQKNEEFSSRFGILMSSLGMAVGTGNIWRFPRVAAENGGGAFLIPWILFAFAWCIPLVLTEFALGKHTRRGPAAAIGALIGSRYNWMGVFISLVTAFITFYYSVVTGWCLKYFFSTLAGSGVTAGAQGYWTSFTTDGVEPVVFHAIATAAGCFIIYRGVVKGIEGTNRILVPSLFILLAVAAVRAATLDGAGKGLGFLFQPEWARLGDYRVWLAALSQSAWSVGAGWGLITTYGVYLKKKDDFVRVSYLTAFGDYIASLLAGIAVMCTVFAVLPDLEARQALGAGNQGLTFVWLPPLFDRIPLGRLFLPLFFLALSFAAISSLIAQLELVTRMVMDFGLTRERAVPLVGGLCFVLGLPSAWSMGFFDNQDWVWGVALIVSGLLFAVAVIRYGPRRFRDDLINTPEEPRPVGSWFMAVIAWLVPVEFVALVSWWLYQAATVYDPENWWHPFHSLSAGTVIFQCGVLLVVVVAANRFLVSRLGLASTPNAREP
jgi:NSS family neurotransmitter:Na+ symporter